MNVVKTGTLELTIEEAQNLNALLDIAVKAGGLQVASVAVMFSQKLVEAFQPAQESDKE